MITNFLIFFKKSPLLALLNSKRLEISPKNGWRARITGEPTLSFPNWRREWDSFFRLAPLAAETQTPSSSTQSVFSNPVKYALVAYFTQTNFTDLCRRQ